MLKQKETWNDVMAALATLPPRYRVTIERGESMNRQLWTIGVVALICCMVLAIAPVSNTSVAQQGKEEKTYPANWRYRIITQGPATLILLDTQTGRCWMKIAGNAWVDLKSPPSVKE